MCTHGCVISVTGSHYQTLSNKHKTQKAPVCVFNNEAAVQELGGRGQEAGCLTAVFLGTNLAGWLAGECVQSGCLGAGLQSFCA
jgi:hypothetical protein